LGTECAGYLKVAKASEGAILMFESPHSLCALVLSCLSDSLLSSFVETLSTANARIASLEAELKASQKAYDAATAAKAIAEKSQKSAIAKAKKAEKALADANQEHAQREQAVAERLHTMSTAAESKFLSTCFLFFVPCCTGVFVDACLLLSFLLL
jgi:DNA anti-recombination protein RmuC